MLRTFNIVWNKNLQEVILDVYKVSKFVGKLTAACGCKVSSLCANLSLNIVKDVGDA